MSRLVVKNTFLDFTGVEANENEPPSPKGHSGPPRRARSAEPAASSPCSGPVKVGHVRTSSWHLLDLSAPTEPLEEDNCLEADLQLDRLNKILAIEPAAQQAAQLPPPPEQATGATSAGAVTPEAAEGCGPSNEELRALQRMLGQAVLSSSVPAATATLPNVSSSGSVSTMIESDDGEDRHAWQHNHLWNRQGSATTSTSVGACSTWTSRSGGATQNRSGPGSMHKAWSSGSVCSLASAGLNYLEEETETEIGATEAWPTAGVELHAIAEYGSGAKQWAASTSQVADSACGAHLVGAAPCYATSDAGVVEKAATTMMLRNVPNKYTQRELAAEIESLGFAGTFDFLYLPVDRNTMSNVGYAFINFIDSAWAEYSVQVLTGYAFNRHQRHPNKVATVSVARVQGLEENVQHYERTALGNTRLRKRRPMITSPTRNGQSQ